MRDYLHVLALAKEWGNAATACGLGLQQGSGIVL